MSIIQWKTESKSYATFTVMEKKLLRFIMNPSFIVTFIIGSLVYAIEQYNENGF